MLASEPSFSPSPSPSPGGNSYTAKEERKVAGFLGVITRHMRGDEALVRQLFPSTSTSAGTGTSTANGSDAAAAVDSETGDFLEQFFLVNNFHIQNKTLFVSLFYLLLC